jgi:hypothetical protein
MTGQYRSELHALRGEIGSREPAPVTTTPSAEDATELERAVHELRLHLEGVAKETEEIVTDHPIASLAAAFCVGMIVGRLSGAFR